MRRSLSVVAALLIGLSLHAAPVQVLDPDRSLAAGHQASRPFIIEPQHVLSEDDKATLAAAGIDVRRALAAGRYLVRARSNEVIAAANGLIRSSQPLSEERKLHSSAIHQAAKGGAYARVSVIFDDDISFEDARQLIANAGGSLDRLLEYEFEPLQRLVARVPPAKLGSLASDVHVLAMYGAPHLRIVGENAQAADLSNVTPLRSAPYNLTGQGIVLSYFELASGDVTHPEFQGRLISHVTDGSTDSAEHATHTAGTMISAGIVQPQSKGMAPDATLHGYDARSSNFLRDKERELAPLGVVADNNSWGYVFGWCREPACTSGWEWTGNSDLYGGYIDYNAIVDKITRAQNVLFLQSAGNDAGKVGPTEAPFIHGHQDENGDTIKDKIFCYSADGTGNDCPVPACTAGPLYCEVVRHPVNAPFMSVGLLASSKNTLTVGAALDGTRIGSFSSRGPARDGRVKPELVARGVSVLSTVPGGAYGSKSGTSMATPVVTGIAGLIAQQWRLTFGGASPLAATIKTLLIATATDMGNVGPDYTFGFGLANAKAAIDAIRDDNATGSRIRVLDATQGSQLEIPIAVTTAQPLRVTLGWSDPEVLIFNDDGTAGATLVNDLDVKVIGPAGDTVLPYVLNKDAFTTPATRGVNKVDNTELVEIPGATPGTYRVVVTGTRIASSSPQKYVLIANAPLGAAVVPCTDATEPNDTAATAYGFLAPTQSIMGRLCAANDVDFFKIRPDRPGTISVVVTAVGGGVRVTLASEGGSSTTTADVPAGESRTLQLSFNASSPSIYTVKVEALGAIVPGSNYFVSPSFSLSAPARRRASR